LEAQRKLKNLFFFLKKGVSRRLGQKKKINEKIRGGFSGPPPNFLYFPSVPRAPSQITFFGNFGLKIKFFFLEKTWEKKGKN